MGWSYLVTRGLKFRFLSGPKTPRKSTTLVLYYRTFLRTFKVFDSQLRRHLLLNHNFNSLKCPVSNLLSLEAKVQRIDDEFNLDINAVAAFLKAYILSPGIHHPNAVNLVAMDS